MLHAAEDIERLNDEIKGYYSTTCKGAIDSLIGDIRESLKSLSWRKYKEEKEIES